MDSGLNLDRTLSNLGFEAWRLGSDLLTRDGATVTALDHPVRTPDEGATDYVHARNVALHNHLISQPHGVYAVLDRGAGGGGAAALELCALAANSTLQPVCGGCTAFAHALDAK
jgi:hypothetical protein